MTTSIENFRAVSQVAVMAVDAIEAGCLEKFLYIYTSLVRDMPKASWAVCADQALTRSLPKVKP